MTATTSKASAQRWLDAHVGQRLDTFQVTERTGRTWTPGSRTLARVGRIFTLDGSRINLAADTSVVVTDASLQVVWHDGTEVIHTTTYTEATA